GVGSGCLSRSPASRRRSTSSASAAASPLGVNSRWIAVARNHPPTYGSTHGRGAVAGSMWATVAETIVELRELRKDYSVRGPDRRRRAWLRAVDRVSFSI